MQTIPFLLHSKSRAVLALQVSAELLFASSKARAEALCQVMVGDLHVRAVCFDVADSSQDLLQNLNHCQEDYFQQRSHCTACDKFTALFNKEHEAIDENVCQPCARQTLRTSSAYSFRHMQDDFRRTGAACTHLNSVWLLIDGGAQGRNVGFLSRQSLQIKLAHGRADRMCQLNCLMVHCSRQWPRIRQDPVQLHLCQQDNLSSVYSLHGKGS